MINLMSNCKKDQKFSELPVSTQTAIAYLNCTLNIENIFDKIPVEKTEYQDTKKIKNGKHGAIYQVKNSVACRGIPSKKGHFRNQLTASIFVIDKIVTIKIFPNGKLHLTGCKNSDHQKQAIIELIRHIRTIHSDSDGQDTYIMDRDEPLKVIIEVVMVNVDFNLDYSIDLSKLDKFIQGEKTPEESPSVEGCDLDIKDFYSNYNSSVTTSVNIKIDYPSPEEKKYDQIIFGDDIYKNDVTYTVTTEGSPKMKKKDTHTHTFLVFSSKKVIQSGRFQDTEMPKAYKLFKKMMDENQKKVELQTMSKKFDIGCLSGV